MRTHQVVPDQFKMVGSPTVRPPCRGRYPFEILKNGKQDGHGGNPGFEINGQHYAQADQRPNKTDFFIVPPEPGPERRGLGRCLKIGGIVEQAVGD